MMVCNIVMSQNISNIMLSITVACLLEEAR